MPRTSPAAERVGSVLRFLSENTDRGFSLSELSRRLGIRKTTCHALVGSLLNVGLLRRDPKDSSIYLGPAVYAIGALSMHNMRSLFEAIDDELSHLAQRYTAQGTVATVYNDEIVILDVFGMPGRLESAMHPGQRLPHRPPLGAVFVAWGTPEDRRAWLEREQVSAERYEEVFQAIRARRFAVSLEGDETVGSDTLASIRAGRVHADSATVFDEFLRHVDFRRFHLLDIEAEERQFVRHLAVPLVVDDGHVPAILTLTSFRSDLSGEEIVEISSSLVDSARRLEDHLILLRALDSDDPIEQLVQRAR